METTVQTLNELIKNNDLEALRTRLESNPELVNEPDGRGFTPLIIAAYFNVEDAVSILLEYGADVDKQDGAGNTALMGTCYKGYVGIARQLIAHGADVHIKSYNGATALVYAVNFEQTEIAKLLLSAGADTSAKDDQGQSLADIAKAKGNHQLASLLNS